MLLLQLPIRSFAHFDYSTRVIPRKLDVGPGWPRCWLGSREINGNKPSNIRLELQAASPSVFFPPYHVVISYLPNVLPLFLAGVAPTCVESEVILNGCPVNLVASEGAQPQLVQVGPPKKDFLHPAGCRGEAVSLIASSAFESPCESLHYCRVPCGPSAHTQAALSKKLRPACKRFLCTSRKITVSGTERERRLSLFIYCALDPPMLS
jgi:hypothetical protein